MMDFLRIGFMILMIFFLNPCFSQSDTKSCGYEPSGLKIGYNGSIIYPGANLGIELPIKKTYLLLPTISDEIKSIVRSQFLTVDLSWYHHPGFHDNLYLTAGWTFRRTSPKGWFWDISPAAGLSRTFLGGTTYKVDDKGNVTVVKLAGYYYALVSLGGGLGYDFSVRKLKPFQIFYKFNLLNMYPYNSTIYIRPAMEIGMIFKIPGFLPLRTKIREIAK